MNVLEKWLRKDAEAIAAQDEDPEASERVKAAAEAAGWEYLGGGTKTIDTYYTVTRDIPQED